MLRDLVIVPSAESITNARAADVSGGRAGAAPSAPVPARRNPDLLPTAAGLHRSVAISGCPHRAGRAHGQNRKAWAGIPLVRCAEAMVKPDRTFGADGRIRGWTHPG